MMNNTKKIQSVTIAGMAVNIVLGVIKVAAGILSNSRAVLADGIHSISDLTTDIAVLVGSKFWDQPADESHPHGHRRIETLVALFIGFVLFAVAAGILYDAVESFKAPPAEEPGFAALAAALISIIVKEILYKWTLIKGTQIKSSALTANAWHHRSDALSSIPAALAVSGSMVFPELYLLDPIGAAIVTIFIFNAAWKISKSALWELSDAAAPPEECENIKSIAESIKGVIAVHKCRTRKMGQGIAVDIHIQVDPGITVQEGHDISGAVKAAIFKRGTDIVDVIVHIEPYEK